MDIESIKRKKMQDMLGNNQSAQFDKQMAEQQDMMQQLQQQLSMLESIAKQHMTKEAISRYGTVKIAHPETAVKAIAFVAQAAQLGHLKEKLTDNDFKSILNEVKEGKTNFRFKK